MIRGSFLARRIGSSRLLLGTTMLTVLLTAALGAAIATFSTRALPRAVLGEIKDSRAALPIAITGTMNAAKAASASRTIRTRMDAGLPGVPHQTHGALWSDPLGLPALPHGQATPLVEVAAVDGLTAHAVLTRGHWPKAPRRGQPIPVALPLGAARRLRARPGMIIESRDRISGTRVALRVVGIYRPTDPGAPYWRIDLISASGISYQAGFTTYGPAVTSRAAFTAGRITASRASWVVVPSAAGFRHTDLAMLASSSAAAIYGLQQSNAFGSVQVSSGLPTLLGDLAKGLVVARSLLAIGVVELALLAAAALALAARLLAGQREEESTVLAARGATRWQLARSTLAETLILGVVTAAVGVVVGSWLSGFLVGGSARYGLTSPGNIPPTAWAAGLVVLALSAAVTLWPAIRPVSAGEARVRRGRQAVVVGAVQTGADLALLGLGVIAVIELRDYSAVARSAGGLGIDPVISVAPALALAAVTLVPLRLLPVLARLTERAAARGKRLVAPLASWRIARRPLRQSAALLLVVLSTAALTLAFSQYQTARGSAADQAAYAAGADLRADILAPVGISTAGEISRAPGIRAAMPVAEASIGGGELIALDTRTAPQTVLLRGDLAPYPAAQLWQRITPSAPGAGLAVPGRPAALVLTARLSAGSAATRPGPVSVTASIQDADGTVYQVPMGTLAADGRTHALVAVVSRKRAAAYPIRLLGLSMSYQLPAFAYAAARSVPPARLVLERLGTRRHLTGTLVPFADGHALASWTTAVSSPELSISHPPASQVDAANFGSPPEQQSWAADGRSRILTFRPGYTPSANALRRQLTTRAGLNGTVTIAARDREKFVPGLATEQFLRASGSRVGSVVAVSVGGTTVPIQVVAAIRGFPTVTRSGGAIIVDQAPLQAILASRQAFPLPVTQWWLATSRNSPPAQLRGASVTRRGRLATALLGNPLSVAPGRAALAVGIAAAVLAAIGFSINVAASVRGRRGESALLSALGVARTTQAGQLCLEQLMLTVPAAAAGVLAGSGLAWLLLPSVTLTASAAQPVPSVLVQIPVGWAVAVAAAVAALPVLAAAASIVRRPDPAAELRAAESA